MDDAGDRQIRADAGDDAVEFVEVGGVDILSDGQMLALEIKGERVLLAKTGGEFYAIGAVCTHERAFLDEGALVENVVYCPLHYSAFDIRSGCVLGPPADKDTTTYAVRVSDEKVRISTEPVTATEPAAGPDVRAELVVRASSWHSRLFERVDSMRWLRGVTGTFSSMSSPVRARLGSGRLFDFLHGRWFGHALHPALSDLPIGLWAGSVLLYLFGLSQAGMVLSLAGIATALAAMVTGIVDLTVTDGHERRAGVLHGLVMTLALLIQIGSPVAYFAGSDATALVLAAVGFGVTAGGGYLGGHLVLGRAVMVDHTVWPEGPREWRPAVEEAQLGVGMTLPAEVGGRKVLLHRDDNGRVAAIEDACSHAGGPLSLGKICEGVVTCPWHDSRFRLRDGAVLQGPATFPQPVLEVRITGGWIEVRPRQAD